MIAQIICGREPGYSSSEDDKFNVFFGRGGKTLREISISKLVADSEIIAGPFGYFECARSVRAGIVFSGKCLAKQGLRRYSCPGGKHKAQPFEKFPSGFRFLQFAASRCLFAKDLIDALQFDWRSLSLQHWSYTISLMETECFLNEESLDWLRDLLDEQEIYFINDTLELIADYPPGESPDLWDCHCALAAAEMVAAAKGHPPAKFPKAAKAWLDRNEFVPDEELLQFAVKALSRIEADSDLKKYWDAHSDSALWYESMAHLRERLGL